MDGVKADMVFTDPPYGYNYQSNMRTKSEKFDVLENDDKILDFFPNLLGRVKGFVMICTTWKVLDKWMPLFKQYFDLSNMIIWDKGGGYIGDLKHTFGTDYEIILCSNNNAEIKGKRIGSVWSIGKDKESDYEHPTQKPVELSATAISSTTERGNIVLDCFGGSGSTLIACEQLNRKCYMAELDPKYIDVIINRYINLKGTDKDVFLIRDGKKIPYSEVIK
jgi:DNA modification methylase